MAIAAPSPHDVLARVIRAARVLDSAVIDALVARSGKEGIPLAALLQREAKLDRRRLLELLENHFFCPAVDVSQTPYDPTLLALVPHRLAKRHAALPIGRDESTLRVAFADPDDARAKETIARESKLQILPLVGLPDDLAHAVKEHYARFDHEISHDDRLGPIAQPDQRRHDSKGAPSGSASHRAAAPGGERASARIPTDDAVKAVDQIMRLATEQRATDVHLQPEEDGLHVRLRLDGLLQPIATLPAAIGPGVISRVKILANMDIAERRLPQDGRFTIQQGDEQLDLRISSLPSQYGEKIVIRLLRKNMNLLNLENLRMPPAIRESYQDMLDAAVGYFLVTGPTGSGKTTTLYATLNSLDRTSLNITTLEDPIEYSLPGLTQVQIREDIGFSFATGLRSILRQDPNVILVGEIRDLETVEIACRAALTGHKVFSTLHTNDACQAVTRLLDMGIAPHLIAATLRGVLAQRLVRLNCPECKESYVPNDTERALLGYVHTDKLQHSRGCSACNHTGYKGRMAIFEYFRVDETMHRLIMERASPYALRHAATRAGMVTMAEFARRAVLEGTTTVAEIQRVILADEGREQLCSNCQRVVSMDFTVCPFCKHVLKETCGSCGAPVESSWEACPACGDALSREWQRVYCKHCFAPIDRNWSECHYCGGEL